MRTEKQDLGEQKKFKIKLFKNTFIEQDQSSLHDVYVLFFPDTVSRQNARDYIGSIIDLTKRGISLRDRELHFFPQEHIDRPITYHGFTIPEELANKLAGYNVPIHVTTDKESKQADLRRSINRYDVASEGKKQTAELEIKYPKVAALLRENAVVSIDDGGIFVALPPGRSEEVMKALQEISGPQGRPPASSIHIASCRIEDPCFTCTGLRIDGLLQGLVLPFVSDGQRVEGVDISSPRTPQAVKKIAVRDENAWEIKQAVTNAMTRNPQLKKRLEEKAVLYSPENTGLGKIYFRLESDLEACVDELKRIPGLEKVYASVIVHPWLTQSENAYELGLSECSQSARAGMIACIPPERKVRLPFEVREKLRADALSESNVRVAPKEVGGWKIK